MEPYTTAAETKPILLHIWNPYRDQFATANPLHAKIGVAVLYRSALANNINYQV